MQNPIRACEKSLGALALWLRAQRERAGLTYAEMADATGRNATTLARAAEGRNVPTSATVRAYATACAADVGEAEKLWKKARAAAVAARGGKMELVRPEYIRDFADIHAAMVELRRRCGQPSLRELDLKAGGMGLLPPSTVSLILRRKARPPRALFLHFVVACDVTRVSVWADAWDRANGKQTRVLKHAKAILQELRPESCPRCQAHLFKGNYIPGECLICASGKIEENGMGILDMFAKNN
ncbi:helix-turn-helix domain-containing protein [Streptomyces goshikiensis]